MDNKKCIETLREYNKWRRGKGRKYSQPGMPLDVRLIGSAIDYAIAELKKLPTALELNDVVGGANYAANALKAHSKTLLGADREVAKAKVAALVKAVSSVKRFASSIATLNDSTKVEDGAEK